MKRNTSGWENRLKREIWRFSMFLLAFLAVLRPLPGVPALAGETEESEQTSGSITVTGPDGREMTWLLEEREEGEEVSDELFLGGPATVRIETEAPEIWYLVVEKEDGKYAYPEEEDAEWLPWEEDLLLEGEEAFSIFVKVSDNDGNSSYFNTGGIVVDQSFPTVDKISPTVGIQEIDGRIISGEDLEMEIEVSDPSEGKEGSGISSVRYVVSVDKSPVQQGELFSAEEGKEAPDRWSGSLPLSCEACEGEDVRVLVEVFDRAGNRGEGEYRLTFDATPPVLTVTFDNNEGAEGGFFSSPRTATLSVEERHFDPAGAEVRINGLPTSVTWVRAGEDRYQTSVSFAEDGDYLLEARCEDQAGNRTETLLPTLETTYKNAFTIDSNKPDIAIFYENTSYVKENSFFEPFFVSIIISDVNLAENSWFLTLIDEGDARVDVTERAEWVRTENGLIGRLLIAEEGVWRVAAGAEDRAGNFSSAVSAPAILDRTAPLITIGGIEDGGSYRREAQPVIRYTDANPVPETLRVTLLTASGEEISLPGTWEDEKTVFRCASLPEGEVGDGRYTLEVVGEDLVGHRTEERIGFTLNRGGSQFEWAPEVEALRNSFVKEVPDLLLTETNLDPLEERALILFRDGVSRELEEGNDYVLTLEEGADAYRYTYRILRENFTEDGVYQVRVRTRDTAGNDSLDETKIMSTIFEFMVDKEKPNVLLSTNGFGGPKDGEEGILTLRLVDRGGLESLSVTSEDGAVTYFSRQGEALRRALSADGTITIRQPEGDWDRILVSAVDRAGNRTEQWLIRTRGEVSAVPALSGGAEEEMPEKTAREAAAPEESQESAADRKTELAKRAAADIYETGGETSHSPGTGIALTLLAALTVSTVAAVFRWSRRM